MIPYAIVDFRNLLFRDNILKILPFVFFTFAHSLAWASSIELTKGSSAYMIKADGALSLINIGRGSGDSFEVSGESLGVMFTEVMAEHIEHPVFRIEMKVSDPLAFMQIRYSLGDTKKHNLGGPVYLYGDGEYHQYSIDLMTNKVDGRRIKTIYLYFGNNVNSISIRDISLHSHSGRVSDTLSMALENFLRSRLMDRADANYVDSPKVFNTSLIASLNILAIILFISAAAYYFWRWSKYKVKGIVRITIFSLLPVLISLWIVADIRMIYGELHHLKSTWEAYFKPQRRSDSIFYGNKGYYEFLRSAKDSMPSDVNSASIYAPPDHIYLLMAKYHLYPISVSAHNEEELFKVFYKYPFVEIIEDKLNYLSLDGKAVSGEDGRIIKKYSKDTFIFFKAGNE